jgi:DNA repair protein RecO (recombination protein O)
VADQTVRAVVLRRTDSGESDRRLTIFSRERGKIDVVAKGARKSGSRLAGSSDPLCESILTFAEGRRTRYLTQAEPQNAFRALRSDYDRLTQGLAIAELVAGLMPFEMPDEDVYDLTIRSLSELSEHPKPVAVTLWSQVQILSASGFEPQWLTCVATDEEVRGEAWISPQAGGAVSAAFANRYTDRFVAPIEVLIALSRLRELESPPGNIRLARECYLALYPFLVSAVGLSLPANDAVRESLLVSEINISSVK